MINKLIKQQLEKVEIAEIGDYDPLKHSFHIHKHKEKEFDLEKIYIVKLNEKLLSNSNDILVSNWNAGKYPKQQYMKFKVTKKIAKMIYVYGVYYDNDTKQELEEEWIGWLPIDDIEIIEEV